MPPSVEQTFARRAKITTYLLWATFGLSFIILACDLVMLGGTSLFITPPASGATLAFTVTLLVLTMLENRAQRWSGPTQGLSSSSRHLTTNLKEGSADSEGKPLESPTHDYPPSKSTLSSSAHTPDSSTGYSSYTYPITSDGLFPHRFRLPAIVFSFLYALLWFSDLTMVAFFTTLWDNFERKDVPKSFIVAPIVECVFIGGQIGVFTALGVLCTLQRNVLVKVRAASAVV